LKERGKEEDGEYYGGLKREKSRKEVRERVQRSIVLLGL